MGNQSNHSPCILPQAHCLIIPTWQNHSPWLLCGITHVADGDWRKTCRYVGCSHCETKMGYECRLAVISHFPGLFVFFPRLIYFLSSALTSDSWVLLPFIFSQLITFFTFSLRKLKQWEKNFHRLPPSHLLLQSICNQMLCFHTWDWNERFLLPSNTDFPTVAVFLSVLLTSVVAQISPLK